LASERLPPSDTSPRLVRPRQGRLLAGVAIALAGRLGVPVIVVRLAFVAFSGLGASGILLYLIGWLVIPSETDPSGPSRAASREAASRAVAVAMIAMGAVLLVRELGLWFDGRLVWPAALAAAGLAVAWDDEGVGGRLRSVPFVSGRAGVLRVVVGAILLLAGIAAFLAASDTLSAISDALIASAAAVLGLGLMFGPWWLRLARDLAEERRERIRSEERAAFAMRVHDSVLQTLALIQRHSADAKEVGRLARRQERELRGWLYGDGADPLSGAFRDRISTMCADVEDLHGVQVELVVVGDCLVDDGLEAILGAGREALVNAAKFAGTAELSVYAEVEPQLVTVFVRDRGLGFEPDAVAADRHGIRDSIVGRMTRAGGSARIASAPGSGTEVELTLPKDGA